MYIFINAHNYDNRNRAIHGDKVAIELLPTKEWKGKSRALPSNPSSSVSHDKSCDMVDPLPTGRVIGIIHRTDREIVSSFPVSIAIKLSFNYLFSLSGRGFSWYW